MNKEALSREGENANVSVTFSSSEPYAEALPSVIQDRLDLRILRALRSIIQAVDIYSRKLARDYQITGPQLVCLLTVVEDESMSMVELSQSMRLRPSTLVGIVDRLEKKGLVERRRDIRDRRCVHVTATDEGRKLASAAPSPLQDSLAAALKKLPDLEQTAMALSLERIVQFLQPEDVLAEDTAETLPETDAP